MKYQNTGPKRKPDVVVLSDVHLGTYGCHAKELLCYLKSIKPKVLVLNGDIIDIWQFSKRYWPKAHMKVVKHILGLISKGVEVYYIPGNHDETLRRFAGFELGSFRIVNKVVLQLDGGSKAWIFHGDVFDVTMQYSKWLARLGAVGYDALILLNRGVNWFSVKILGKGKISLSKKVKNSVKSAVKFINCFERTAADIGISNGYDYVICGHIHHPEIREISNASGKITYLNSGDWIENLTALEYSRGQWSIRQFRPEDFLAEEEEVDEPDNTEIFSQLLQEFNLMKAV
jgi:UDP-2,3-diacylglucosamine pyrophosphatase LpxH